MDGNVVGEAPAVLSTGDSNRRPAELALVEALSGGFLD
jgi:hypothetical protein